MAFTVANLALKTARLLVFKTAVPAVIRPFAHFAKVGLSLRGFLLLALLVLGECLAEAPLLVNKALILGLQGIQLGLDAPKFNLV
jgi:hypothetical protein